MSADGRGGDVGVIGVVGAHAGEQVQGGLPVMASLARVAQGQMGVGQSVVSADTVGGLVEFEGEVQGFLVVAQRVAVVAGGVVDPT